MIGLVPLKDVRRGALGCALAFIFSPTAVSAEDAMPEIEPTTLKVRGAGEIAALQHTLKVPENRSDPDSREIELRYVVLPAIKASDKAPVVYLAGGPGGSGTRTAESRRWPLFDALRQTRDVILLDQRGTGRSEAPPPCASSIGWSQDDVGDRATFISKQKAAFSQCEAFWLDAGVDLNGYTTAESAADIAAVAEAVGGKVSLLGISYGTHLALATLKQHEEVIDRAILVSVEGLDQTVKLPARTDAFLARLQTALNASLADAGKPPYPDLGQALTTALARIERDQPQIEVYIGRNRPPVKRTLGPFAVQLGIAFALSDPHRAHDVVRGVLDMASDEPDYALMQRLGFVMPEQIRMRAMPTIMDLASGISDPRLDLVETQAQTALLGDATNFPMPQLSAEAARYRLPDSFRTDPVSATPALVISGTLDGRTYPESAIEATSGLTERTILTVENAGHNLFFDHPQIIPSLIRFLDGEAIDSARLVAPLPPG